MDNDNLEEVERKLKRYNQEHLLDYYNNLEDGELKTKFKEQLERIDFELIDSLYKNTTKELKKEDVNLHQIVHATLWSVKFNKR